jgi:hypothetical protein
MARKTPHTGSSFESWLEEARIREDVTAVAIKADRTPACKRNEEKEKYQAADG